LNPSNHKEKFLTTVLSMIISLEFAYVVRTVNVILNQLYKKDNELKDNVNFYLFIFLISINILISYMMWIIIWKREI